MRIWSRTAGGDSVRDPRSCRSAWLAGTFPALTVGLAMLALGAAGCATGGGGGGTSLTRGDITREEIETTSVDDVMEAISLLRPQWLRYRPARTPYDMTPVVGVVIDGMTGRTREDLAQIPVGQVERISFLNASDATIRYGTGYGGGAIVLVTRN